MSVTPTLVTGDDSILPTQLFKEGLPFVIDTGATVKASVVSKDRNTIILAPVTVASAEAGSDWASSIVVPKFATGDTSLITAKQLGTALLEIQVDDGGKLTWFVSLKIVKGTIDQ